MKRVVLLTAYEGEVCAEISRIFDGVGVVSIIRTINDVQSFDFCEASTLLSFGTGVIVPVRILKRLARPAYNLHPGTPEFPGRDPHHHAVYRGAKEFGATLHIMTAKVDDGPIVAVERFNVEPFDGPIDLMFKARTNGISLLRRLAPKLVGPIALPTLDETWGPIKTRRSDMLALSRLTTNLPSDEVERRIRAFDVPGHNNLTLLLHGHRFILDRDRSCP